MKKFKLFLELEKEEELKKVAKTAISNYNWTDNFRQIINKNKVII